MTEQPALIIRDAYLQNRDELCDISVTEGTITAIAERIESTAETEIDAEGDLVSPGFVDAHVHMDQALSLGAQRCPAHNTEPFDKEWSMEMSAEYFAETDPETIEETVVEVARMAVANGVTHARTHAYIDETVGTKSIEAVEAAGERVSQYIDIEIVAFPQQGLLAESGPGADLLRESIEAGADLVGGIDPATVERNITETLDTVFEVATEQDVGIDIHLHDSGSLGVYTLDRLVEWIEEYEFHGRVTASHCYALADAASQANAEWLPASSLDELLARFADVDLSVVTSYLTTPPAMPVRELQEADIALGHGSDQVQDFWIPHGNIDPLEEALIQSLKLGTNHEFATNAGLERIWTMLTHGGARVLDIGSDYPIDVETPADLVIHGNRSRQRTIIEQSDPRVVLKDGAVVARNGTIIDES